MNGGVLRQIVLFEERIQVPSRLDREKVGVFQQIGEVLARGRERPSSRQ